MIPDYKKESLSRFEAMLGFGLLALIVLVVLPPLKGGMEAERPLRAALEAETVAQAVLDYHTDMGHWPMTGDGQTDLALLVPSHKRAQTRALAKTMNSATDGVLFGALAGANNPNASPSAADEKTWLKEVPVDPWDRPFRVVILGNRTGSEPTPDSIPSSGYPDVPPPGTAIVVLSSGPNGLFDTDLARFWSSDNSFGGDDLGFVLTRSSLGEGR
jgi:hypothetical protein